MISLGLATSEAHRRPGGRVDPALAAGTIGSGGADGLDSSREISDPAADSWWIAVTASVVRMYHSHAMTVSCGHAEPVR
jgi:hypothetical protein